MSLVRRQHRWQAALGGVSSWLFPSGFWNDSLTWDDTKLWGLES